MYFRIPFLTLAAACIAATVNSSSASASDSMKMTVVERATSDAVLDLGAKDGSAGDVLTFANDVYDEANKTKIGSDNGWCVRTVPGKAWECTWTTSLKDGQITVEGPYLDAGDSIAAVTGGTGKYAAARGEMKLHARDAKGSEYDFAFSLLK